MLENKDGKVSFLGKIYIVILLFIFGGIIFHAPINVGFGTLFPDYSLLIKSWKEILMIVAGLIALFLIYKNKQTKILRDPVIILIIAYAALHVLLLIFNTNSFNSVLAGLAIDLRYVLFFGLVYIALRLYPEYKIMFLKIGIICALISLVFALLQVFILPNDILKYIGYGTNTISPYLTVDSNHDFIRINGTFRGPNPLGSYAVIVLSLISSVILKRKIRKEKRPIFITAILLIGSVVALWASYSRSAMIGAIIAVFIVLAVSVYRKLSTKVWITCAVILCALAGGLYMARNSDFVSNVILHEDPSVISSVDSNAGHMNSLKDGVIRMLAQPFGAGIGSTGSASLFDTEPITIENQYLSTAHETGWVGLTLFCAIFGLILVKLWLKRDNWLALGVFSSGIGLGVIGILLPVWVDDSVSIIWWGLAAIALSPWQESIEIYNPRIKRLLSAISRHWKLILLIIGLIILCIIEVIQFFYPNDRLLPFTSIDGLKFSSWQKNDVVKRLDDLYAENKVPIFFGTSKKPYISPKISELGLTVSNESRINKFDYPWYYRIIPTSIYWAYSLVKNTEPDYKLDKNILNNYILNKIGDSCDIKASNAKIVYSKSILEVIPSQSGGSCDMGVLIKRISGYKPILNSGINVIIPMKETKPEISDSVATKLSNTLQAKAAKKVILKVGGNEQTIYSSDLLNWLSFSVVDGKLTYNFDSKKVSVYLSKNIVPKVAVSAGVTTITTHDFEETVRTDGVIGKKLDITATENSIKTAFEKGGDANAIIITVVPTVVYNRTYSATDQGLTALMQQYAMAHTGVESVSLIELSGARRRASINESKSNVSASTYKVFVAYSVLRRIESGEWKWEDKIVGSRNVSKCFDDMIVLSDNACAEAFLYKITPQIVSAEAKSIGCNNMAFSYGHGFAMVTSYDLSFILAQLESGQILTQQSNRDLMINTMKRNVYRNGIPAGINAVVADKVGFINGVLNDAAIVYSPTGTYVLVIMTDGESWGTIADLASKIEALRNQN